MGAIFVVTSHTAKSDARSGVQAVVRGLLSGLSKKSAHFQAVRWAKWRKTLLPLNAKYSKRLVPNLGTIDSLRGRLHGSWLLLPEVIYHNQIGAVIAYARAQQMRVAAIFYDAIPISHPELVRRKAVKYHADYMTGLCDVDLLIPLSQSAADEFRLFVEKRGLPLPTIHVCTSAGDLLGEERPPSKPDLPTQAVNILCVSTLEPRKNHKTLLEAFELASAALSQPDLRLQLVGDRYEGADFVVDTVKAAMARNPNVIWHGKLTDDQLMNRYSECDFTIYPSVLEGFGLPIIQSLWNRRPCICANFGTMAETANGGGCLTVDVRDAAKLRDAILTLATRRDIRQKLVEEIERRHVKTWQEYATEICETLESSMAMSDADVREKVRMR
jgi:glycosyltransferase involved in cell wall biosynthesis